ncbi:hypothetical protein DFP72DRAFT_869609 [Ephemerocybe angulata]|uniref:Uncharacterized protein n=1 Tax=Ephemerocybe angulata TaxID=980116 RepID=A0A8H6IG69_9AGAR|nr:hypothetical protein DFP72DRAFT_869609 [Tulosesus angulatus]
MGSREEFPKISFDKIEDWNQVASSCKREATKIAANQVEEAGLGSERDLVLKHMEKFVDQALESMQPNLRVNGHSFGSLPDHLSTHDMETFDEALDRRIWSLADTRLQWHKRIAENRRTVPGAIRDTVAQLLEQHDALDNDKDILSAKEVDDGFEEHDFETEELSEAVRKNTAFAEELAQTIPMQQGRSERVKVVSAEIKALRP